MATATTLFKKKVHLTKAELLALTVTPKPVIPAPGPGKIIRIISTIYDYTFGTTEYVQGNPGLWYGDTTSGAFADGGDNSATLQPSSNITAASGSSFQNSPAVIDNKPITYSAGVALSQGDGTLNITVFYVIVTR